ncbi:hypothetical protein EON81_29460, partial [bacterium]
MAHVVVARNYPLERSYLACHGCGCTSPSVVSCQSFHPSFRQGRDPLFGLPLWFRQPIGREVVWAYNARHLEDLEFFLRGEWKAHRHNLKLPGYNPNWSWRTRYPKWMLEKANRPALLRAVGRMRRRLHSSKR